MTAAGNGLLLASVLLSRVAWSPARAIGQCCGDCNGNNAVAISELVTAVNRALNGCEDDGICSMASCPAQLATCRDDLADCRTAGQLQRFNSPPLPSVLGAASRSAANAVTRHETT